ncbi:MAG: GDSL-type esterase/lipase family protein [Polyangiaceae bacterium]
MSDVDSAMASELRSTLVSLVAVVASGVVVVTCSATREAEVRAASTPASVVLVATPDESAAAPAPVVSASASASATVVASASASGAPATVAKGPLGHFRGALSDLASGARKKPVRIAWIGDSHTAADFWTGAARKKLQEKYGDAGQGFVHVGWGTGKYRHDGFKLDPRKWETVPAQPATSAKTDDGVFGLGGIRFEAAEPSASASLSLQGTGEGKVTWDLAYRNPAGSSLRVKVDGGKPIDLGETKGALIQHRSFSGNFAGGKLEVEAVSGRPQLFGAVVERDQPGIVLDTLGIGGARVATTLVWDEPSWTSELTRRAPQLVVVAFGTNESQEKSGTEERYQRQMDSLLTRVRAAAPDADCVVITPMDRSKVEAEQRLPKIAKGFAAAAAKHRCVVWSAFDVMGGEGSMQAWINENPPRAQADGIHLSARGYAWLGDKLGTFLMEGR